MTPWALVPVKGFDHGKSRLGEVLDGQARAGVARALFDRVVGRVLCDMARAGELGGVLVVTDSEEVVARTRELAAEAMVSPGVGPHRPLGAIVDEGLAALASRGVQAALVIMGDLPALTPEDVRALAVLLDDHDVALAPDAAGTGTNALAIRLPARMPTRFCGGESLAAHVAEARARTLHTAMCTRAGLALDVDEAEDYARLRATL